MARRKKTHCPRCDEHLTDENCSKAWNKKYQRHYWQTYCRKCSNEAHKEYRRNPEQKREYDLQRTYGISLEAYDRLYEEQEGVCAICGGTNRSTKRLSVDHNHETGEIRGLLCSNCNFGLGYFRDSTKLLAAAIQYLPESAKV